MAIVHSSYAWGQLATIIITTILINIIGYKNWNFIVLAWALVPFSAIILCSKCWYPPLISSEKKQKRMSLFKSPYFLLCLLAIMFGGATEILINQWASAFLENSIKLPKLLGDILGIGGFALMMGLGRTIYGLKGSKVPLSKMLMRFSIGAFVCYVIVALSPFNILNIVALALSGFFVALMWPSVLTIASERFPYAGAFLFGVLAIFGDLGASIAPTFAGSIMDNAKNLDITHWLSSLYNISLEQASMRLAILVASILPICTFILHLIIHNMKKKYDSAIKIDGI